jgi:rod shape-determining protein MreC
VSQFKRLRDAAIAILLLAVPFFVLNANLREPGRTNSLDQAILQLSASIQSVARAAAGAVSGAFEDYVYLVEVQDENDRMRAEVARLTEREAQLSAEALENRRLRSLLSLRERVGGNVIAAQVIGRDVTSYFRVTRIEVDRGERDHVREGMPVVAARGLVGQIRRTWGRYSDVLLLVDAGSAVDVIVQRTGARGMLRGTGEDERYMSRIEYLGRDDLVRVGDLIHTSGLGQRFPASILVGRVTRIVRADSGMFQEVEVAPAVDFSTLDEVLVLSEGSREQARADVAEEEDEPDTAEP